MSTTIRIPTVLRKFAGGSATVEVTGSSVLEVITQLTQDYPALQSHLFAADGSLRSFVNIYVDDEDVRHASGIATGLNGGEVLSIVPAVAGGI
jgi:molybdopterin converting factor small subunit